MPMYERPHVVPMIAYENGVAALEWLAKAFGFVERARFVGKDGQLSHGEMSIGDGLIMLATPTPDYQGPKAHREECAKAKKWSEVPYIIDGVLVTVQDVNAHHECARAAGAHILSAPEDTPHGRIYRCEDIEGHRWMFAERKPKR